MRAIFFGTPKLAVPSLDALTSIAEVVGVVCQPDKPAGRGLELRAPPVKARALELGLDVLQPTKVRTPEFAEWVADKAADVALVIAYGRILPKAVLDAPRRGCMNLHASLLPKYRGAAPITWAIANGETKTGVCLMQMDEGMDTGPVFTTHELAIDEDDTTETLGEKIAHLAADVVRADLARAVEGALTATPQDPALATAAPMLQKDHGRIDWNRPAKAVHDHIRAMTPWPGAFTTINGKTLKILESSVDPASPTSEPGQIVEASKEIALVACAPGLLRIHRAQLEGRKPLPASDLIRGRTLTEGLRLGS